ncbi:MAG: DNA gyrase modulator, partial [Myxococcota bacterium]
MADQSMIETAKRGIQIAEQKGAREAGAVVSVDREVSVTFRDGKLEKISEATRRALVLRLYVDGRFSAVSTSDLRPDALGSFIENAVALTRVLAADPYRTLPDPALYKGQSDADLSLEDPRHASL